MDKQIPMFEDEVNAESFDAKQCDDPECGCHGTQDDEWDTEHSWIQVGRGHRAQTSDPRDHGSRKGIPSRPVLPK